MRLFELFNESGYTPPIKPKEYQDVDKLWDYLKTDAFEEINEVIKLRNYIVQGSNNYSIPPKNAFGRDEKNELLYALSSLKKYFQEYNNAQILKIINEIDDYLNSMN